MVYNHQSILFSSSINAYLLFLSYISLYLSAYLSLYLPISPPVYKCLIKASSPVHLQAATTTTRDTLVLSVDGSSEHNEHVQRKTVSLLKLNLRLLTVETNVLNR